MLENISDDSDLHISTLSKGKIFSGIKADAPDLEKIFSLTYLSHDMTNVLLNVKEDYDSSDSIKDLYYISDGQLIHFQTKF